jgi:hypothetical protein
MSEPANDRARPEDRDGGEQEQSGPSQTGPNQTGPSQTGPSQAGPNLAVMYALIAFALAAAIGFALLIVLPFYRHRH